MGRWVQPLRVCPQGRHKYRMYYRGLPHPEHSGYYNNVCYAESQDGVHWTRPDISKYEVNGKLANNVILKKEPDSKYVQGKVGEWVCHNFCPFVDDNPATPPSHRYKAVGGTGPGLSGLFSADGIQWDFIQEEKIFTDGAFDSLNVPFWSSVEECYVLYFRSGKDVNGSGYRWISRTTSPDFINWNKSAHMTFGDIPPEHYYTNGTHPYFRAPHIYVAMPGRRALTDAQHKRLRLDPTKWEAND